MAPKFWSGVFVTRPSTARNGQQNCTAASRRYNLIWTKRYPSYLARIGEGQGIYGEYPGEIKLSYTGATLRIYLFSQ